MTLARHPLPAPLARRPERGFAVVLGVIILFVVMLMVAAMGYLVSSGVGSGALSGQSADALFIARSGAEYAGYQLNSGKLCNNTATGITTTAQTMSGGSFTNSATTYSA